MPFNREKYINKEAYPSLSQFTTTYWYAKGKMIASQKGNGPVVDPTGAVIDIKTHDVTKGAVSDRVVDTAAYDAGRANYSRRAAEISQQFHDDAVKEFDLQNHPFKDKILSMAWDDGHSAGLEEVWNRISGLSDDLAIPNDVVFVSAEAVQIGAGLLQHDIEIQNLAYKLHYALKAKKAAVAAAGAKGQKRGVKKVKNNEVKA